MPGAANDHPLRALIRPRSIAVIGASSEARKAGGRRWLSAISQGFAGAIYAVNRTAAELNGYKAYKSVAELPGPVDMAVVIVPTAAVPETIAELAAKGVKAVVVITAGFSETGAEGRAIEARMRDTLRQAGARMLGSNSAGVFSAAGKVNTIGWQIPAGGIAVVTQSGNMAGSFTYWARAKRVGIATMLAMGNSADLALSELVELVLADEATRSVLIYCEGFHRGDGRRLVEVARGAATRKPIVMLKPGQSEAGKAAALSHTGSLAGEDAIADAAFAEAGIIRAIESEEAFDVAMALAACPPMRGRRLAVISDGGGHATVVADCAGRHGLTLARFGEDTKAKLRGVLPVRSGIDNPVDFAGFAESDPDCTSKALAICIDDPDVDGLIFAGHFGGYQLMTEDPPTRERITRLQLQAANEIVASAAATTKPIILHSDHAERELEPLAPLRAAGIPVYASLESAAKAMAALARWGGAFARAAPEASPARAAATRALSEPESRALLTRHGIAMPEYRVVGSAAAARDAFVAFKAPVALKLIAAKAIHKSDLGAVLLGLDSEAAITRGFDQLEALARRLGEDSAQVLITPMIEDGVECIIGAKRDPQFGPVVLFGAGGVLVELTADSVVRLAPIDEASAMAMIAHAKIGRLLAGFRGQKARDRQGLARLIAEVSRVIAADETIVEIDLNPVIVTATDAAIADARVVVG